MTHVLRAPTRVWVLIALVWAAAAAVTSRVQHADGPPAQHRLSWWVVALLFFVAEVCVVHVHLRGDAHSFSLSEVPLVLGLFCLTPMTLVGAHLAGAGLALVVHRRQSLVKLLFNLGQFALSTSLALVVFHLFAERTPLGAPGWSAAIAAALVSALVGVLAIATVISVSQGKVTVDQLPTVAVLVGIGAATNSSAGALAGWVAWTNPIGLWLMLLPVATLVLAYRAYITERQRHDGLRFIHESTRLLHATPELDHSVMAVLVHVCEMVRAETAEIILFAGGDDAAGALRWRVGADGTVQTMESVDMGPAELYLAAAAMHGSATILTRLQDNSTLRPVLEQRGIRDALVAALRSEDRLLGLMIVGNRLGEVSTFDREDARLIDTLVSHLAVALENGQLERSLAQLTALQHELTQQAFHDALTGLANRSLLRDRIEHSLRRRGNEPIAVLFIDLDDFKTVNDSLGHAAGDEILKSVAQRVRACLRPSDTAARLGGDEFAVFLEDAGGLGEAMTIADRIHGALRSPFHVLDASIPLGASIGIAMGTPGEKEADELLSDADMAMYTAKLGGKGGYEIFQPQMRKAVQERHELKARLQRAVANEEFVVHYQPIVHLGTGQIVGAEALVRWHPPGGELLLPDSFIPLAEETGLINDIGALVLRQACRDAREWCRPGPRPFSISVNLSGRQLSQPDLVDQVVAALRQTAVPPESLMLEITETMLMKDSPANVEKLQDLRRLGVRVAIDDFGTGYSSMSYLRHFPIDVLKVAKPFVDALGGDAPDGAFTEAIVRLGQSLGVELVAEGIVEESQRRSLESMGCQLGQGFLFAPAVDRVTLARLMARDGLTQSAEARVGAGWS